jgi:hypothetical protein
MVTLPVDEELYLNELNVRRSNSRLKEVKEEVVVDTNGTFGSKN